MLGVLAACGPGAEEAPPDGVPGVPPRAASGAPPPGTEPPLFRDAAAEAGLDFVHVNGMTGEYYYLEIFGSGAAVFDYDNDDDLDVYLVQGGPLGGTEYGSIPGDRLYRNESRRDAHGSLRLAFEDVTTAAGIDARGYGMGVAAGDYDNDGWIDLYLANYGGNQLWRNRGDGTFEDVTERSGTGDQQWGVPAVFFDYDRDGWLDLFVGNYLHYSIATHEPCADVLGGLNYCGPLSYDPQPDLLLHNRGDGTFEDVTASAGLSSELGRTLGAIEADFNLDGWPDLYVANDATPNHLWINNGDSTFSNTALIAGCAVNELGHSEGSMGVDAGDFDADGDEDVFITHITRETNTLFVNDGEGSFLDRTMPSGLGPASLAFTGFGTSWIDFDRDGWLDLLVVNGAVRTIEAQVLAGDPFPLHQSNLLFRNLEGRAFEDVTSRGGSAFAASEVSRGVAVGDVDNDGDLDVVVNDNNRAARLLINQSTSRGSWLGLRLVGEAGERDMLGAWVGVLRSGTPPLWRRVRTSGSYGSSRDPRLVFELGPNPEVERIQVQWPDGSWEEVADLPLGRYSVVRQGSGRPIP